VVTSRPITFFETTHGDDVEFATFNAVGRHNAHPITVLIGFTCSVSWDLFLPHYFDETLTSCNSRHRLSTLGHVKKRAQTIQITVSSRISCHGSTTQ